MLKRFSLLVVFSIFVTGCSSSTNDSNQSDSNHSDTPTGEVTMGDTDDDDDAFCPVGSMYDEQEDSCYIDCTDLSDEQCDALDEDVFGEFDEFLDSEFGGDSFGGTGPGETDQSIAKYTIEADLQLTNLENQQPENAEQFQQIWQSARSLLPDSSLKQSLSEFHISSDGKDETLAYVTIDENQAGKWIIAFDNADYTSGREPEFVHTTIHEFGHIVFLGSEQIDMNSQGACPNYAIDEGCSNADAFLNSFYQQFWLDIIDEQKAAEASADPEEALARFYEKYQDHFVSDYAATNPVEDAAEVFTRFVLTSKPAEGGPISQQKIRSLHNFPEMVRLRGIIRGKLNSMR